MGVFGNKTLFSFGFKRNRKKVRDAILGGN